MGTSESLPLARVMGVGRQQQHAGGKRSRISGFHVQLSRPNTAGSSAKHDGGAKKKIQHPDKNATLSAVNLDPSGEHTDSGLVCKSCHDLFVDDSAKILECENCGSHCCAKCLKLTTAQYLTTHCEDLWWTCSQACRSDIRTIMKMRNTLNENTQWKSKIEVFENSISRLEEKIDIQRGLIDTEDYLNDLTKPTRDPEEVPNDDTQQEEGSEGPWRLPKNIRTRKIPLCRL